MANPSAMDVKLTGRLEKLLESYCEGDDGPSSFPSFGGDRFAAYSSIKQILWQRYYRDVPAGLNTTEALKNDANVAFTHHDVSHIDDVIERMASILGVGSEASTPAIDSVTPFSLFVLLVACLVHDAGNREGREGHSNRARAILNDVGKDLLSTHDIRVIAKIAAAHGGRTVSGQKDTIRPLGNRDGVEGFNVNPSQLAATLRFADELADTPRRGSSRNAENSIFANLYCKRINTDIDYVSQRISIGFVVYADELTTLGKNEKGDEIFFLDYIYRRLEKMELERRYCAKFLQNFASYNSIRVAIDFYSGAESGDHEEVHLPLDHINFEMADHGFPVTDGDILPDEALSGAHVAELFATSGRRNGRANIVTDKKKGGGSWMTKIRSRFTSQKS